MSNDEKLFKLGDFAIEISKLANMLVEREQRIRALETELAASKAQSAQLAAALYAVAGCSDRTIEGDVLVFRSVMEQVSTALTAWQQANK
jgi:hypothetical protein